ncbi:MAG: ABC transporter substrate-binding protein [Chitinivibrionales bacterium]|nr:ABC transporter substrate-binding protein [Chitinivibrionales bacterium]MBD3395002.1 ABC transporter substrate-binding protein [Chitinivibrionales bacterium]
MHVTVRLQVCSTLVLVLLCGAARADRNADSVMARARELYQQEAYDSTIDVLRTYLKKHGKEPSTEYTVPLLMEALLRTNDLRYFDRLFAIYQRKFTDSKFMPRLLYLRGIALARREEHEDAVVAFSRALKAGVRSPLDSLAVHNTKLLCRTALTAPELGRLVSRSDLDPRVAEVAAFYEFSKLYESDRVDRAREKAEAFRKRFPGSVFEPFARNIIGRSRDIQRKHIPIGLLAPISGYDADIGRNVVHAAQLAVDRHNARGGTPVRLVIRDTEGKGLRTAELTREMVNTHDVPVIIGPVLSSNAIVAGAIVMEKDIVMVTPTATDEGIAGLSPGIFQVNVTPGTLGRRIAAYAMEHLSIRDFAIMAPLSDYGKTLSASFRQEVEQRGGEVVAEEDFDEGAQDYREQFIRLRTTLMRRRQDTLGMEQGIDYAGSTGKRTRRADSLYLADSTMSVGGLFLPAEAEDVVMLAPQVHFHRIRTQLLGSTGWHTSKTLLDGKRYVEDAIISTSFQTDTRNEHWVSFAKAYRERFDAEPDRVAAPLAYDACVLVLNAVNKVGDDPRALSRHLLGVKGFRGVSGAITFEGTDGANAETAIMKIKDRAFVRIQ